LVIAAIVLLVQNWDKVTAAVGKVWEVMKDVLPKAWEKAKEFAGKVVGFVKEVIEAYLALPGKMFNVGKDIVTGLWNGIQNMASWLKDKVTGFFKNLLPSWAEKALGISSPSKVFASIGKNIIGGLQSTFNAPAVKSVSNKAQAGIAVPRISLPSLQSKSGVNITINAGLGTNGAALGRQVSSAIRQYGKVSTQARF
jgi:phage-related protein